MSNAFTRWIQRPVAPILTSGLILELLLWWIYKARLFATRPQGSSLRDAATSTLERELSEILGPTPPEWVLPVSAAVALITGLTITVRMLRNGRNRIGTWHGGKLVVVAAVSAAIGWSSWALLDNLSSGSTETLGSSITIGFLSAMLASGVIVPLTAVWLWLSARESR